MATSNLTQTSQVKCHNGFVRFYKHPSDETKTDMTFAIYLPPKAVGFEIEKCPVVYWLSGLTCNEQNFITKAGATKVAAELNLILVCPDTSPRGCDIEGENDSWDFGSGAGFYVDATEPKWSTNYRMYSYITKELPQIIENNFPVIQGSRAVFGHSMGGHGAFICALKNPGFYKSVSAFAPICNPMKCPWGEKALTGYLGVDKEAWKQYDACELAAKYTGPALEMFWDQGTEDGFLKQNQLLPGNLKDACASNEYLKLNYRAHEGYDHSYYFITTFIEDHLRRHAKYLGNIGH